MRFLCLFICDPGVPGGLPEGVAPSGSLLPVKSKGSLLVIGRELSVIVHGGYLMVNTIQVSGCYATSICRHSERLLRCRKKILDIFYQPLREESRLRISTGRKAIFFTPWLEPARSVSSVSARI